MKPASRIQATIEILEKLESSRVPLDALVGDYMRARRYIGSKDRAEVAERIYSIMRAHARLGWWIASKNETPAPRMVVLSHMLLAEGMSAKRANDLFDGTQFAPTPLNDAEKSLSAALEGQNLSNPDMPDYIRSECPPGYEQMLRAYFGEHFAAEMSAMLVPAALDVRVNTFVTTGEKVQASLKADGVECAPTPYSPVGLRLQSKAFLSKTKAFNKGWIEIQDEGSQLIAHVCGAQPGMQVLDYCAGGGGKTLALASAMQKKGRIVAMDIDERRLEKGRQRFRKAHMSDIIEIRPLSDERHRKWLRRQKETFDIVLADVPCSGTGTWRRNPDMRWKHYGPGLEELRQTQADILDKIAPCVKPGGRLIYATCSLLQEENETQVESFLARHPAFRIEALDPAQGIGSPFMRLTPYRHKTDGFFAAVMVKIGA